MDFMDDARLEKFSSEKSVRGAVVRKARARCEEAGAEEKAVVEEALKMLLEQFEREQEDGS